MREEVCSILDPKGCTLPAPTTTTSTTITAATLTSKIPRSLECTANNTGDMRCDGEKGFSTCSYGWNI